MTYEGSHSSTQIRRNPGPVKVTHYPFFVGEWAATCQEGAFLLLELLPVKIWSGRRFEYVCVGHLVLSSPGMNI